MRFDIPNQVNLGTAYRKLGMSYAFQRDNVYSNAEYFPSNIPCEIGLSEATGKDYASIVYLVEKVSR